MNTLDFLNSEYFQLVKLIILCIIVVGSKALFRFIKSIFSKND